MINKMITSRLHSLEDRKEAKILARAAKFKCLSNYSMGKIMDSPHKFTVPCVSKAVGKQTDLTLKGKGANGCLTYAGIM